MKPLGTITLYLPFVDSITRQIIEGCMRLAINYKDFSRNLCNSVCSHNAPEFAIFSSVHHATNLYDYECLDKVAKAYGDICIIQPNLYFASSHLGGKVQWNKARSASELAYNTSDSIWVQFEMLLNQLRYEVFDFTGSINTAKLIDRIKEYLRCDDGIANLEYRLYDCLAQLARVEGNFEESILCADKALELAQRNSDELIEAHLFRTKATLIQRTDHQIAKEYLFVAEDILVRLGDEVGISNIRHQLGVIDAVRGLYDSAIEYSIEAIKAREKLGMPLGVISSSLATLYNAGGYYDTALEWAELAEAELTHQQSHIPRVHLSRAWSLIEKGKVDEASLILDSTRDIILKSGIEPFLADMYFVDGLIDMANREYNGALVSLEKAYEINQRIGRSVMDSICLEKLAIVELESLDGCNSNLEIAAKGHWIRFLEEHANSKDLPGIEGQALLLKAELRIRQGQFDEAARLLEQVRSISEERKLPSLLSKSSKVLKTVNQKR